METVVAIPTSRPGGLNAPLGSHFGHCDLYTLVTLKDGSIHSVDMIPKMPHQQGGCMATVNYLASQGARALIAGGMGLRPLMGFKQIGIQVFFGGAFPSAGEAVAAFIKGRLPEFSQQHTCGGGQGH